MGDARLKGGGGEQQKIQTDLRKESQTDYAKLLMEKVDLKTNTPKTIESQVSNLL